MTLQGSERAVDWTVKHIYRQGQNEQVLLPPARGIWREQECMLQETQSTFFTFCLLHKDAQVVDLAFMTQILTSMSLR